VRILFLAGCLSLGSWTLPGCGGGSSHEVNLQTVDVACARCVFHMDESRLEGIPGCPWAAEIEGRHHLVYGPVPQDHFNHAPDGICNMRRQAKVEGNLRDDKFIASTFELLPPTDIPAQRVFTEDDKH
jgi:hypothetical protein